MNWVREFFALEMKEFEREIKIWEMVKKFSRISLMQRSEWRGKNLKKYSTWICYEGNVGNTGNSENTGGNFVFAI